MGRNHKASRDLKYCQLPRGYVHVKVEIGRMEGFGTTAGARNYTCSLRRGTRERRRNTVLTKMPYATALAAAIAVPIDKS